MHDEKKQIVNGIIYRYSTSWIYKLETEEHWRLYWHQQKLMEGKVKPGDSVLEIGVGTGFTANYLRSKGVNVTTLDIDPDKKPDIVANIVIYKFSDTYDHILAFQVFEDIPFDKFIEVIKKIGKVCRKYLFMSIPRCEHVIFRAEFKLPKIGYRKLEITLKRRKIIEPHHYWEIDYKRITADKIRAIIEKEEFKQVQKYKVFSNIFFAFKKVNR